MSLEPAREGLPSRHNCFWLGGGLRHTSGRICELRYPPAALAIQFSVVFHGSFLGDFETADALNALKDPEAKIALRMRDGNDRRISFVLEVMMIAFDPR